MTVDFRCSGRFPATALPVRAEFDVVTVFLRGFRDFASGSVFGCRLEVFAWMLGSPLRDPVALLFVLAGKFCRLPTATGGFVDGSRRRVFAGGAVFVFTGALGTLALKVLGLSEDGDTFDLWVAEARVADTLAIIRRR